MKHMGSLLDWWRSRAQRERVMLVVMLLAVAAFLAWFALLRPLSRWQQDAAAERAGATALLAEVRAARAELARFQAALPDAQPEPVALEELLPRSATAAGVALSRQQERDGLLIAGIDAVQAPALLAWLDALARRGVAPVALDLGERDGHLHAEVAFARPALPDQPGSDP